MTTARLSLYDCNEGRVTLQICEAWHVPTNMAHLGGIITGSPDDPSRITGCIRVGVYLSSHYAKVSPAFSSGPLHFRWPNITQDTIQSRSRHQILNTQNFSIIWRKTWGFGSWWWHFTVFPQWASGGAGLSDKPAKIWWSVHLTKNYQTQEKFKWNKPYKEVLVAAQFTRL